MMAGCGWRTLLCVIGVGAWSGLIRADEPVPAVTLFATPQVQLRKVEDLAVADQRTEVEVESDTRTQSDGLEELAVERAEVSSAEETAIQVYESINQVAILSKPEFVAEPGGAIGWFSTEVWDPVFAPEVVKVGKVTMTGGVVAAWKRKNPFCLLNPLAFSASW